MFSVMVTDSLNNSYGNVRLYNCANSRKLTCTLRCLSYRQHHVLPLVHQSRKKKKRKKNASRRGRSTWLQAPHYLLRRGQCCRVQQSCVLGKTAVFSTCIVWGRRKETAVLETSYACVAGMAVCHSQAQISPTHVELFLHRFTCGRILQQQSSCQTIVLNVRTDVSVVFYTVFRWPTERRRPSCRTYFMFHFKYYISHLGIGDDASQIRLHAKEIIPSNKTRATLLHILAQSKQQCTPWNLFIRFHVFSNDDALYTMQTQEIYAD